MATFTVSSGDAIRPIQGGVLKTFREGASQSFLAGAPLILDTTTDLGDRVVTSGADPAAIVGIAAEDATGTTNAKIQVWVPREDTEFLVTVENAETLDNDAVGDSFGIVYDSTYTIWRLDQDETSAPIFTVLRLAPGYVHGDVNGKYVCSIKPAERQVY